MTDTPEAQDIPQCMLCGKPSPVGDPCKRCKDNAVLCMTCQKPATHYGHSNVSTPFTHKFVAGDSRPVALPELLEKAREKCTSCGGTVDNPKTMLNGSSNDRCWSKFHDSRGGAQPDTPDLQGNIESNDRLAEGLVRGVQEMGASQAKLPVHIDGETWDVTVRFRGAQPEPDSMTDADKLSRIVQETGEDTLINAICQIRKWRAGSSPAPSPALKRFTEAELQEHAIQLGAIGMCGINRELWETRREINMYIEKHFRPLRVTGNEGKVREGNRLLPDVKESGASAAEAVVASPASTSLPDSSVASPAVEWLDTELWNFAHGLAIDLGVDAGHETSEAEVKIHRAMAGVAKAYHHQQTVVTPEQQSAYNELNVERYHAIQELQRKVSELEAQLQQAQKDVEGWKHDFNMYRSAWLREMGGVIVPKHHEIDGFVLRAREIYEKAKLVDRMKKILCDQEKAKVGAMEMFDAVFKFLAEDKHDKVPTN